MTNDGSGVGVIKELATPPAATVPLDRYDFVDWNGSNAIDPTQYYIHGTTGEKLKATYYQG